MRIYCLAMLIIYIAIAVYDWFKKSHSFKYIMSYLGIGLCFLLYIDNFMMTGFLVGMACIFYQMHLDTKDMTKGN